MDQSPEEDDVARYHRREGDDTAYPHRRRDELPWYRQVSPGQWITYAVQLITFIVVMTLFVSEIRHDLDIAQRERAENRQRQANHDSEVDVINTRQDEAIVSLMQRLAVADSKQMAVQKDIDDLKKELAQVEGKVDEILREVRRQNGSAR